MKYHKKLKRAELLKYGWRRILMMAASEFSRAHSLANNGGGKEMQSCFLRAKELVGVAETDLDIPQTIGIKLFNLTNKLSKLKNPNPKLLYTQSMALAS